MSRFIGSFFLLSVAALALASAVPASAQISPQKLDRWIAAIEGGEPPGGLAEPLWRGLGLADNFNSQAAVSRKSGVRSVRLEAAPAKRIIIAYRAPDTTVVHVYLCDRRANLVSAGTYDVNTKVFTPVSVAAARAGLQEQLRYWDAEELPN
jgi:hypothetical protein